MRIQNYVLALAMIAAATALLASEPASAPACCAHDNICSSSETSELSPVPEPTEGRKMKFVMTKLSVPHCKRGPERCELCRKSSESRWCLLDVDPPDKQMVQRPVLDIEIDGERHFFVYDVIKSFVSEEEALTFLKSSELTDIYLNPDASDD